MRTPLSLAQAMAAAGGAAEGTAAFLVLEAAKPWSRKTHKYFQRRRAAPVELWPWAFRFSRQPRFARQEQAMFDVWMTGVLGHAVTRTTGRRRHQPLSKSHEGSSASTLSAPPTRSSISAHAAGAIPPPASSGPASTLTSIW